MMMMIKKKTSISETHTSNFSHSLPHPFLLLGSVSLCAWGWPQTLLSALASHVLGLQACIPTHEDKFFLTFWSKISKVVYVCVSPTDIRMQFILSIFLNCCKELKILIFCDVCKVCMKFTSDCPRVQSYWMKRNICSLSMATSLAQ